MVETKYNKGDVVTINNKDWVIEQITMRFGKTWTYGLKHETAEGKTESMTMETGSLETLMKHDGT